MSLKAAVAVGVRAARRQQQLAMAAGGVVVVVGAFDSGDSMTAFNGGNGLWLGNDEREMSIDCGGGGWWR